MVRDLEGGSGNFLHSKEGVTQGDPLSMITYGIGVLPLIRELPDTHPRFTQTWYAYDVGLGSKFGQTFAHFRALQARGTPRGYFLELTNSTLVVAPRNVAIAEDFLWGMGIKVVTGSHYPGRLFRNREAKGRWLEEKLQG